MGGQDVVAQQVMGRTVTFPVQVRDASAGTATFLADLDAAASMLPVGLEPLRVGPRHTLVTLVMVDYRDNDLGDYDEAAIQLAVAPVGEQRTALKQALRGSLQTWTVAMPVNQEFTWAAGRELWGFPKTVDDVRVRIGIRTARCTWHADGEHVLSLQVPAGSRRAMPAPPLTAWTVLDGRLQRTDFGMQADHGRVGSGRGVRLELGTHPVAKELRRLGLPRRPLLSTWMSDVTATFGPPEPV